MSARKSVRDEWATVPAGTPVLLRTYEDPAAPATYVGVSDVETYGGKGMNLLLVRRPGNTFDSHISRQQVTRVTCPTADHAPDGTAHTIIGCGSTNVMQDDDGLYDCLDCGIFWDHRMEATA